MADLRLHGTLANRFRLVLKHATTGVGLTGLTEASAGLIIATLADTEAVTVRYRASSGEIETITTLGTWAAPTADMCRFKEVDAVNHPGLYEVQLDDARLAVVGAKRLILSLSGAADLLATDYEVQLTALDVYTAPASAAALATAQADLDTIEAQTTGLATAAALAAVQADVDATSVALAAVQADVDAVGVQTTGLATSAALATAQAALDVVAAQTTDLATSAALALARTVIDAIKLQTDAIPTAAAIADAHLDRADGIEVGLTPRGALRLAAAASAGKLSGAPTATLAIRNVGDTKNRIVATVDADGNRTAVVTDVT